MVRSRVGQNQTRPHIVTTKMLAKRAAATTTTATLLFASWSSPVHAVPPPPEVPPSDRAWGEPEPAQTTDDVEPEDSSDAPSPQRERPLWVAGVASSAAGGLGLLLGFTGVGLGRRYQQQAEDPDTYDTAYDEIARKGRRANALAAAGFAAGAASLGLGVLFFALDRKRTRRSKEATPDDKVVRIRPSFGGMILSGRF